MLWIIKKTLVQKFLIGQDNCKRLHKFLNTHNGALSFEYVFKFLFCFRGAKWKLVECKLLWWGFWKHGEKNDSELSLSYAQKALSETKKPNLTLNKTHIYLYILS